MLLPAYYPIYAANRASSWRIIAQSNPFSGKQISYYAHPVDSTIRLMRVSEVLKMGEFTRREPVAGKDFPRNRAEFAEFFSSRKRCSAYLCDFCWPDGFQCLSPECKGASHASRPAANCGALDAVNIRRRPRERCSEARESRCGRGSRQYGGLLAKNREGMPRPPNGEGAPEAIEGLWLGVIVYARQCCSPSKLRFAGT